MLFIIARRYLRANGNDASAAIPAVNLFAFASIASVAIEHTGSIGDSPSEEVSSTARWFLRILIDPLLGFAFLFATFYGYSRMAEGTASGSVSSCLGRAGTTCPHRHSAYSPQAYVIALSAIVYGVWS